MKAAGHAAASNMFAGFPDLTCNVLGALALASSMWGMPENMFEAAAWPAAFVEFFLESTHLPRLAQTCLA